MKAIEFLIDLVIWLPRTLYLLLTFWLFWWGARRERKWVLKNERYQDDSVNPVSKRWEYAVKKSKALNLKLGVKVVVKGEENLPKGSALLTPNHISNADSLSLIQALGEERETSAVAKIELSKSKLRGYFEGLEAFYVDRNNFRQSVAALLAAGKYTKSTNRYMVVFPEGKRTFGGKTDKFNDGVYSVSKKLLLPVVPVTIVGTEKVFRRFLLPGTRTVTIIFGEVIKPKDVRHKDAVSISKDVQAIIQNNLDKYYK